MMRCIKSQIFFLLQRFKFKRFSIIISYAIFTKLNVFFILLPFMLLVLINNQSHNRYSILLVRP